MTEAEWRQSGLYPICRFARQSRRKSCGRAHLRRARPSGALPDLTRLAPDLLGDQSGPIGSNRVAFRSAAWKRIPSYLASRPTEYCADYFNSVQSGRLKGLTWHIWN